MALDTVEEYVSGARILLQDEVVPYRYSDASLLQALNFGILEARKSRPDLFIDRFDAIPDFSIVDTTAVVLDDQYKVAFLHYMCGHAHLRDDEDSNENMAAKYMDSFNRKLLTVGG